MIQTMKLGVVGVALLFIGCNEPAKTDGPKPEAVHPAPPPPTVTTVDAMPVEVAAAPAKERSEASILRFAGDDVVSCSHAWLEVTGVSPDVVAHRNSPSELLETLLDEAITLANGGDSTLSDGVEQLTKQLAVLSDARWRSATDRTVVARAEMGRDAIRALRWPHQHAEAVKRGELARVDSCPPRYAFGQCEYGGGSPLKPTGSLEWRLKISHFDLASTVNSDAAMRFCLAHSGKWTAPDPEDPEFARHRATQRAKTIRRALE